MVVGSNGYNGWTVSFANHALKLDKAADANDIVSALASNPNAECLNLSGNTLGIDAAKPIGIALEKNRFIKRCLFNDLFTGRLKSEIAPALKHLSNGLMVSKSQIVELDLSDNAFGPNGVVGITDLLASNTCHTLEILRMNNQGLGHEGCRYLAEALEEGRCLSKNQGLLLKIFSGGRNRLENVGAQMLSKVFCDMGSLEELSLYQNGIGIHGIDGILSLVKIIKSSPNLRVLNLSDNSLTPRGGEAIARALPSVVNLEELYLSDCILRSTGVKALASAFEDPDTTPNLRVLNLTGNEIKLSAGINLILSLGNKSHLELLDLNANEFGRSGVRSIIQTLDSVGLLHTLPNPNDKDLSSISVVEESYLWAFDEDQGSDQEGEDDETNEGEEEDVDNNDAEEYDDSRSRYGDDDDERENQTDTTSDQKESVNFSFREAFSKFGTIGGGGCLTPKNENIQINKPGPFGTQSLGLFSGISPQNTDTTDAGVIRSKLWPSSGLFNFGDSANTKRNLFSPPILSNKAVGQVVDEKKLDEDKLRQLLNDALSNPKQESSSNRLIDFLGSTEYFKQPPIHPVIMLCTQTASPENIVRLSLILSRSNICQTNSVSGTIMQLAIGLLASIFTDIYKKNTDNYRISCAINCLLVYLGAIKPEKDSEDWIDCSPTTTTTSGSNVKFNIQHYLRLTKTLIDYFGPQLIPSVCNCLTVLLSEQRKKEIHSNSSLIHGTHLRDDIIDSLEKQMNSMNLKR
ncbi:putative ran gtpase-activating protein [Schistosoma mansoni]|uniref:Putative ran gtpase-activating protein n=1 Tax=Schistosoma mansoni TaxID=6183 RepID=G4VD08_SCHMA|nr:putative ran gtpase-activating protein [Schistosoma mansoni]|eukprot:XP_018650402.1 putative ran gtpase-activating protein [Schistosoma mansoni]